MAQIGMFDGTQKFKIDKPIRLVEIFAGIGAQSKALERLGADFESWYVCEFDKYAIASYNAIHGTNYPTSDVTKITAKDLNIIDTDKYIYILTYSFPCFVGDSLVLTKSGLKKIKDINLGDKVLTHNNIYQEVLASKCTGVKNIYSIKAMAFDEIKCTSNHKFYCRENNKRKFTQPEWVECGNLTKKHYLGVAINQNSILPDWNGIDFVWKDGRKTRSKNQIKPLLTNHSFWYLIGRYLGDGWKRHQGGIIICCDKTETEEITPHIENCGFNYSISKERTVNKIHIPLKELELFVSDYGFGAANKKIPGYVFDMPIDLLKAFLKGYLDADGCFTQNKFKISSVSKELIYGISQIVAKVYQRPYSIYKTKRRKTCIIEGRKCNQKDSYTVVWKPQKNKQDKAFYENGYIWFPIKDIIDTNQQEKVYDIEVEKDHSFTVNGCIVHNCQDLSIAGKQSGMQKGSGTRSGLLWEVERLLDECDELPQVLLMENVPQVHSEDNIGDFNAWLRKLESLGYKNYYKDLNSKDFGVPQNRNRTFCVSILGDYYYEFPDPIPLKLKLKDLLEPAVDEKYYLNDEKIKTIMSWNAYQKPLERVCGKNSVVPTLTARGAGEEHSGMITCCEQFENTTNFQEKYSQFVNVERERERERGRSYS